MRKKSVVDPTIVQMVRQANCCAASLTEYVCGPGRPFLAISKDVPWAQIIAKIQMLGRYAERGHGQSVKMLYIMAMEAIRALDRGTEAQPALFRHLAGGLPSWPVKWSNISPYRKPTHEWIKRLGIGVSLAGMESNQQLSSKATSMAINIAGYMVLVWGGILANTDKAWAQAVWELEPLSQETAPVWWVLAEIELRRCFPRLHKHLTDKRSHPKTVKEACRRIRYAFLRSSQLFKDVMAAAFLSTASRSATRPRPSPERKTALTLQPWRKHKDQKPGALGSLTYRLLALIVLVKEKCPMTAEEIWRAGKKLGLSRRVNATGKTPADSLSSKLYIDMKRRGVNSVFAHNGSSFSLNGSFKLRF